MSARQRHLERARLHEEQARLARRRAECHALGDAGEAEVAVLLAPLEAEGWTVLHKRQWPGTSKGDLDHVLIGPGGVVVVDTKNWHGEVRLIGEHLLQGQADVTDRLEAVGRQVEEVEAVLAPTGLVPVRIRGAMAFCGVELAPQRAARVHVMGSDHLQRWVRALGRCLDPEQVAGLAKEVADLLPPHADLSPVFIPPARGRPRARAQEQQLALVEVAELDLAELERAAQSDIETWMSYIHPSQLEFVRKQANGPSRVRGPAGCGKTVVALHRGAHLATREPGDLLITSYVRTLPAVLGSLYGRLSPETASRVTFAGVHRVAYGILADAGVPVRFDPGRAKTQLARAWATCGRSLLGEYGLPQSYWFEEVDKVIRGRGLLDFDDEYAFLARTGRRTPLSADQRRRVWDFAVRYQELLDEAGVWDATDLVAEALKVAEAGGARTYRFVIVDEVQDLDLLSLRLLASLVSEERDGLTLVGDGQQAVYAGGFTLREAGISVTGRSTILRTNYRNTREVLDAARELVRADAFDDLGDLAESGERDVEILRSGSAVCMVHAQDTVSADVALVRRLLDDRAADLSLADGAVLTKTVSGAQRLRGVLRKAGIETVSLEDYDGRPVAALKVGTVKRAKGLEFVRVYLPDVQSWSPPDGCEPEQAERDRRELFVGMTRARDGLWMCRVQGGTPPEFSSIQTANSSQGEMLLRPSP